MKACMWRRPAATWSEPRDRRPSTSQRRQAQRGSDGQPTTQQLVDLLAEGLLGPNGAGECLWHQHNIGLVAVLLAVPRLRADSPRPE